MNASSTQSDASPPPPPTPPPPAVPRRRLVRRTDDRTVAGVCAGVADYFDTDPVLVRLITIALAFAGPGIILYGAAWVLVPEATDADLDTAHRGTAGRERSTDGRTIIGAVLVGVAVLIASDGWFGWLDGGLLFALGLIAIGGYLLLRDRPDDDRPPDDGGTVGGATSGSPGSVPSMREAPGTGPATTDVGWGAPRAGRGIGAPGSAHAAAPSRPAGGTDTAAPGAPTTTPTPATAGAVGRDRITAPLGGSTTDGGAAGGGWGDGGPPVGDPYPPKERRRSSPLGIVVVAIALLAVGALALLDTTDVIDVDILTVLATGLLVVGAGLVVGAWYGRARWLIGIGVVLAAALAAVTVIDLPFSGGIGERSVRPTTVAEAEAEHLLMLGELRLDLTDVPLDDLRRPLEVVAHVGVGSLEVLAPPDVTVVIDARAGLGEIVIAGRGAESGFAADRNLTLPASDAGPSVAGDSTEAPEVRLDVRAGVGEVQVSRG